MFFDIFKIKRKNDLLELDINFIRKQLVENQINTLGRLAELEIKVDKLTNEIKVYKEIIGVLK